MLQKKDHISADENIYNSKLIKANAMKNNAHAHVVFLQ